MKDETISVLENNLTKNLQPVLPNPDFIKNLGNRLVRKKSIQIENPTYGLAYLLISFGLFIGALLIWLFKKRETA